MLRALIVLMVVMGIVGPARAQDNPLRILALGDSVMAFHRPASIPNLVASALRAGLLDRSQSGARITAPPGAGPYDIRVQARRVPAPDVVLINGGFNDFAAECGCSDCTGELDRLLGADGQSGHIARLVDDLARTGARIYWLRYYDIDLWQSPARHCTDEVDALSDRLARLAQRRGQVVLFDARAHIDPGNLSHYDDDLLHLSVLGNRRVARALARQIGADFGIQPD